MAKTPKEVRIAFCGASGCGKTTLAKEIVRRHGLLINPVGSRSVARELGFDLPYDVDRADRASYFMALREGVSQEEAAKIALSAWAARTEDRDSMRQVFQDKLLADKRAWEAAHDSFVTDRSVLDNLAYTRQHTVIKNKGHADLMDQIQAHVVQAALRYTHIFFCPVSTFQNTDNDPGRVHDPAYHARYEDWLIQGLMDLVRKAGGRWPIVLDRSGNLRDRLETVEWVVGWRG